MAFSSLELLQAAELLLSGPGAPSETRLRRAVSSAYYALFHALARDCADLLIGKRAAFARQPAWRQAYRALDHGETRMRCQNRVALSQFPAGVVDFATTFVVLQGRRHDADYDPYATFTRAEVQSSTADAFGAIGGLIKVPIPDRRAFCAYLLFRDRRS